MYTTVAAGAMLPPISTTRGGLALYTTEGKVLRQSKCLSCHLRHSACLVNKCPATWMSNRSFVQCVGVYVIVCICGVGVGAGVWCIRY